MPADAGTIFGIIGAITGIGGLIMGAKSLHQTQNIKSQELRMERSRLINNTDIAFYKARTLLEKAHQSKRFRYSRQGIYKSTTMEKWKKYVENRKAHIEQLNNQQFNILASDALGRNRNIENQIQRLHLIEQQINLLIETLNNSIEDDKIATEALTKTKFGT